MTDQPFPAPGGAAPGNPASGNPAPGGPATGRPAYGSPAPAGSVPVPPAPAPPPGSYAVPVGGYPAAMGAYQVPSAAPASSKRTGAFALIASLLAAVVAPIIAGILAVRIGTQVLITDVVSISGEIVYAALSPVRTEVLWVEIVFWVATILGILALVLGIVAIARRRGRGMGIAAVVLAVVGPGGFFLAVSLLYGLGNGIGFAGSF